MGPAIAGRMRVIITEDWGHTRTLYLDPRKPYCRHVVLEGSPLSQPENLAPPHRIHFYLVEDMLIADNHGTASSA
ncbi:TPA: hypothetical protein EYP44_04825 [Candidatus Bathyarchaeota archaeon]|nr:hypothetical protein [Candidatus Bathyarchaeota archaeon]